MSRPASLVPAIRLSRARGHLLCVVRLPRRDPTPSALVGELALVVSLAAPNLRRLAVFHGRRSPVHGDTPRAA